MLLLIMLGISEFSMKLLHTILHPSVPYLTLGNHVIFVFKADFIFFMVANFLLLGRLSSPCLYALRAFAEHNNMDKTELNCTILIAHFI